MGRVDRRRVWFSVGLALSAALLTGCGWFDGGSVQDASQLGVAPAVQPRLIVNPADGAAGVSVTEKVTASVTGGQLTQVALTSADGAPLAGALSPDGQNWTSVVPLKPATAYILRAGSRSPSGEEATSTTRFRTLTPGQEVNGKLTPDGTDPVAVNQFVSVLFDKPIADRVAVEHALRVSSNPATTGTTEWRSDRELLWKPTPGWTPGSRVTVSLDLYGKQLGGGLVGSADLRTTFAVAGDSSGLALRAQSSHDPAALPSVAPKPPAARVAPPSAAARPNTAARAVRPSTPSRPSSSRSSSSSSSSSSEE